MLSYCLPWVNSSIVLEGLCHPAVILTPHLRPLFLSFVPYTSGLHMFRALGHLPWPICWTKSLEHTRHKHLAHLGSQISRLQDCPGTCSFFCFPVSDAQDLTTSVLHTLAATILMLTVTWLWHICITFFLLKCLKIELHCGYRRKYLIFFSK